MDDEGRTSRDVAVASTEPGAAPDGAAIAEPAAEAVPRPLPPPPDPVATCRDLAPVPARSLKLD